MIQLKCIFETDAAATISRSVFSSNRFLIGIRYGMQLNIVSFFFVFDRWPRLIRQIIGVMHIGEKLDCSGERELKKEQFFLSGSFF